MTKVCFLGRTSSNAGIDRSNKNLIECILEYKQYQYYATLNENFQGVTNLSRLLPSTENAVIRNVQNGLVLPFRMKKYGFDIIHGLTMWLPLFSFGSKRVVTAFDIAPIKLPELHTKKQVATFRYLTANCIKSADKILAISEATKNDLIEMLGVDNEKINIVNLGVDHGKFYQIKDNETLHRVRVKYKLPERFILAVSTIEPKKNYVGLLKIFKEVLKTEKTYKLVIAGQRGWKYHEVFDFLDNNPELKKAVIMLGFVEDHDLPALYNLATLLVFPSVFEGFGLPPLEAMCCGTPVVASNMTSIPEVVEDAGILADPSDIQKMTEGVISLLKDENLRKEYSKKGIEQSKKFSWKRAAKETVQAYEEVMK